MAFLVRTINQQLGQYQKQFSGQEDQITSSEMHIQHPAEMAKIPKATATYFPSSGNLPNKAGLQLPTR